MWIRLAENDPTLSRLRIETAAMGPAAARSLAAALAQNTHLTDLSLENTGTAHGGLTPSERVLDALDGFAALQV